MFLQHPDHHQNPSPQEGSSLSSLSSTHQKPKSKYYSSYRDHLTRIKSKPNSSTFSTSSSTHLTSSVKRSLSRSSHFRSLSVLLLNVIALLGLLVTPTLQEDFDIKKLLEYNSLANCMGQIHKDFEACNTAGAEKAQSAIANVELGTEWSKRLKCCGMWKLRDCWMRAARTKCTKAQAEQVFNLPKLFMPGMAEECRDYTAESGKCTVPMWLIASVVSAGLFILGTCLCGTVYCIRRVRKRRSRRRRHSRSHHHTTGAGNGRSRSTSGASSQTTQLMSALNGPKAVHANGNSKKVPVGLGHHHAPYMNGNAGGGTGNPKVTIRIEKDEDEVDATKEEIKSLNGNGGAVPVTIPGGNVPIGNGGSSGGGGGGPPLPPV